MMERLNFDSRLASRSKWNVPSPKKTKTPTIRLTLSMNKRRIMSSRGIGRNPGVDRKKSFSLIGPCSDLVLV